MRLFVGNIPRLANEEALEKWFARAGLRVEAIHLVRENESRGYAWVEILDDEFPSKALRHLNSCAFWGHPLVVQEADRRPGDSSGRGTRFMGSPGAT